MFTISQSKKSQTILGIDIFQCIVYVSTCAVWKQYVNFQQSNNMHLKSYRLDTEAYKIYKRSIRVDRLSLIILLCPLPSSYHD